MVTIEQPRGTVVLPCNLKNSSGPYTYSSLAPGQIDVGVQVGNDGMAGAGLYEVRAINSYGAHLITIPEDQLLLGVNDFKVFVWSPTGAFDAEVFRVVFAPTTVGQRLDSVNQALATLGTSLANSLSAISVLLQDIAAVTEANIEKTYNWNEEGTEVVSVDIKFLKSDAAPNFDTPDKKIQVVFVRDEESRRVLKTVVREVAL